MRLKYAITIGDPKSAQIVAYQARDTGKSHLQRDDIVASLGITQARCRAGLSLIYAKYTKDISAAETALNELQIYAKTVTKKYLFHYSGPSLRVAASVVAMLVLEDFCRTVDTPGAKCHCGGKGQIRDLKESKKLGMAVSKVCHRCKGSGLKPLTHTRCHHAITALIPISQSTYSRHWRPFYDDLLAWCYRQESIAEWSYNSITSLNPLHLESGD
ncbi:antitermination protein [Buttiauxella sp. S19-1]|uniref:antitermination protein n=1 Tax=Buttiauxella sp. S19-1 TaxID=941430 RepID=UPI001EDA6417|nr:antitermination protein [Buttiauxella sp. S19-1]